MKIIAVILFLGALYFTLLMLTNKKNKKQEFQRGQKLNTVYGEVRIVEVITDKFGRINSYMHLLVEHTVTGERTFITLKDIIEDEYGRNVI